MISEPISQQFSSSQSSSNVSGDVDNAPSAQLTFNDWGEGRSYLFAPVTKANSWLSLVSHGGRPILYSVEQTNYSGV